MQFNWNLVKKPGLLSIKTSNFLLSNNGSLKRKVIRGGFWVFALRIFRRGFEFVRTIILARLLAPEDFGLIGIALLAMSALESFSETGIDLALIQKKDILKEHLNTAWTIQVLRGLVIAGLLFFGAPLVGTFFDEPNAVLLTRALAISEILKAFTHIGVIYFQKELEFHKQFIYQISGTLADLLVSIPAAIILRNPWALVYGLLAGNFVRLFFSHNSKFEHLSFSLSKYKEFTSFSVFILVSSILVFITHQGDEIFIGRMLGATSLAFYTLAWKISNLPITEVSSLLAQVSLPAFAKMQEDRNKLKKAYLNFINISSFFTFPMTVFMFLFPSLILLSLLGEQWTPSINPLRILALYGFFGSISLTGTFFIAINKPKYRTVLHFMSALNLAIIIFPLTKRFGITGTAVADVISVFIGTTAGIALIARELKISFHNLISALNLSFIASIIAGLLSLMLNSFLIGTNTYKLFLIGIFFSFSYILSHYALNRFFLKSVHNKYLREFIISDILNSI